MTSISLPLLDRVQIASPCTARWEEMSGDERKRLCAECNLHVHNIADLTRDEAEALLQRSFNPDGSSKGIRFCGRLFRRADGTILTQDCPQGLARLREASRRAFARVAMALGLCTLAFVALGLTDRERSERLLAPRAMRPLAPALQWLADQRLVPRRLSGRAVMGEICVPTPPAPTQGSSGSNN
jgi:hypothetical protein